jgi:hypothetical protein
MALSSRQDQVLPAETQALNEKSAAGGFFPMN